MYYIPKPYHLVFSLLLFVLGAALVALGGAWSYAGVFVWLIGLGSAFWIVLAGLWAERGRYYDSLADAFQAAAKLDYDKLIALGFEEAEVPERVQVDLYSGSRSQHFSVPVSAPKMRAVATALLDGESFSERRWSGAGALLSIGEFRSLRSVLREHGLIAPASDKANQQGFVLTADGVEFMRSWISPSPPG